MALAWSENITLASHEFICDSKRQEFSPFCCVSSHMFSRTCCLGKPNSAAREVIWIIARGNSIIIGGNVSTRATANSGRHRACACRNANSAIVLPDVSQSLTIRVVCSVLNDHCRYEKCIGYGQKRFLNTENERRVIISFRSGFSGCDISSVYLWCWWQGTKIEQLNSISKLWLIA